MTKFRFRKPAQFVLLLIVLAFLIGACQTREKGRKPSPDWSRSIPVGVLVRGDIDLLVRGQEPSLTHMVWLQEVDGRNVIHYLQLDADVKQQVNRNLQLPGDQFRSPRILEAAGSNLHLLWSSRPDGRREWDLQYTQMNPAGDLAGEITEIAGADEAVNSYTTASDGQGGLYIVWESDADGALHGAQISSTGDVTQGPLQIVEQGDSPFLAAGGTDLSLIWFNEGNIQYARWPDARFTENGAGETVANLALGTGQTLDGPVLGIAGDWAYVIWSVYSSSGLEAGTAVTKYVAFPKDAPTKNVQQTIRVLSAEDTPYAPYEGAYLISQLALPASIRGSSSLLRQPNPATGRGDELVVAMTTDQESRLDVVTQTGLLLFKDGEYAGYQMTGKTDAFSQEPVIAADGAGNLYMAWREGGRGSLAYFALTTPEGQSQLDRMSGSDFVTTALSGGMEAIAGMLFFPLACIWMIPGLALIGILHFWRGDSDMQRPLTIVVLLLSVILSQFVKLLFLPTISYYVPFSAWVDIAPRWEDPLRLFVPLITMGIGLMVAILMRRRNDSGLAFFFVFIAVDGLLTLAIYGVNFLGVT